MFQRLFDTTKLIWCVVIISSGTWNPVNGGSVPSAPNIPSTIEAQAKFFQDFFSVQLSPYKIEFGHVCEDPNQWEQRYEKKDFKNHRDMGKVRWGDKKGGYGEHYWDLNHAGHAGDIGNDDYDNGSDDGSYHEEPQDTNNETKEKLQKYEIDEYNPDDTNQSEESGRAKRAHIKGKLLIQEDDANNEEEQIQEDERTTESQENYDDDEDIEDEEDTTERPKLKPIRRIPEHYEKEVPQDNEKNHIILIVNRKQKDNHIEPTKPPEPSKLPEPSKQPEPTHFEPYKTLEPKRFQTYDRSEPKRFVPYEGGAGVRQHVHPDFVPSASVPRLFLDQSTGHIIDRTTGQAYMLQPIPHNIHYS